MNIPHAVRVIAVVGIASCRSVRPAPQPSAPPTVADTAAGAAKVAAIRGTNAKLVDEQLKRIAGRDTEPASQIFKNVRFLARTRARTLLVIMSVGYADALGVTCEHCHNVQNFASDEKRPKRAAREMQVMHSSVVTQLRAMTELASQPADQRAINCSTCHRGRINPDKPNP